MRKHKGYTLIEMLLVIIIIAIISSLAILTYRKNTQNNRIDKAALEMQQVLEAALTYNVRTGYWPNANNTLPDCNPPSKDDTFITTYLPNRNYQSNYGSNYCWSSKDPHRHELNQGPLFWVALKISSNHSVTAFQTAQRIAARLPNAIALENPTQTPPTPCTSSSEVCYVRAEVAIPATIIAHKNTLVVGMGYCDPSSTKTQIRSSDNVTCEKGASGDQYTIQFSCPNGEKGHAYIIPNFYTVAALPEAIPPTILTVLRAKTSINSCQEKPADSSKYSCPITIVTKYLHKNTRMVDPMRRSADSIGASYIAYCKPTSHSSTTNLW